MTTTKALLTLNDFRKGGYKGVPAKCDGRWHEKSERVVALSTGWYNGGSRCGKMIRIKASDGKVLWRRLLTSVTLATAVIKSMVDSHPVGTILFLDLMLFGRL
ncbi:hypothetical protein HS088_TW04G01327 [Tripterygium wilfordii]|uniref:Uncharacterized protein n=1 Tax=Tripterygium wilfordii TaxID=458696 RepID=A0A7J7DSU6_TRIWF|nr:hypothetical protein HS088_TW04G01327 [Tripterygium wilfordii]